MNFQEMDDKVLFENLQRAGLVEKLEASEEWKMLKEAANRIIERTIYEFAMNTYVSSDPKDLGKVIRLQQVLRLYKFGLFKEVDLLKNESEFLFEEARDRGMVEMKVSGPKRKN